MDGKTPYMRLKGKTYKRPLIPFGECIHFLPAPDSGKKSALAPKWHDGIFLGVRDASNECWVGTDRGVFKSSQFTANRPKTDFR